MKKQNTGTGASSSSERWEYLEEFVRGHIQRVIHESSSR